MVEFSLILAVSRTPIQFLCTVNDNMPYSYSSPGKQQRQPPFHLSVPPILDMGANIHSVSNPKVYWRDMIKTLPGKDFLFLAKEQFISKSSHDLDIPRMTQNKR